MTTPLLLTGAGFITLTAVFFWLLLRLLKDNSLFRNAAFVLIGWAVFLTVWSLSGVAGNFELFPFNLAPVLIIPFITILVVTFSKKVKELLPLVSEKAIVNLQVFRVFVEILLWALFIQNVLPIQMTFEGRNWDIISGITAPLAALFLTRWKAGLVIWNLITLGLLVNIVTIAILSMPVSFRVFENEPSNFIVTRFPFILLPGMLVPLAYGLSFLSLRQVFLKK